MKVMLPAFVSMLLLCSCNKSSGSGPHATVELRDGTSVAGRVISTSPSEVQIAGDDQVARTIPMSQVRSIEYDGNSAAAGGVSADSSAPVAGQPPVRESGRPHALPHREHYHPTEQAVTTRTHELPAGTQIAVRTEETIDSGKATEGQTFPAEIVQDVLDAEGSVVIPAGANAQIVIRSASKGGRIHGASDLVLDLAAVSIDGRQYELSTADLTEKGHSGLGANRRTAEFAGGGAGVGAIIGAIAGGGKGAAIGAGSGAAAGGITEVLTKGSVKVPVESVLKFQLDAPLRVSARS